MGIPGLYALAGLSIAYSIFYITVVQSFFDLRFDRNFEKADNTFLYSVIRPNNDMSSSTNTVDARLLAERYPEIKNFCFLREVSSFSENSRLEFTNKLNGDVEIIHEIVTLASSRFVEIFQPEILYGDVKQFIEGSIILTESAAIKIFGTKDVIGENIAQINRWTDNLQFRIVAICADFPDNCSLKNGIFLFQTELTPDMIGYTSYFEIEYSNKDRLLAKINEEQFLPKLNSWTENQIWQFELTALPDVHMRHAKGEGNFTTVILLVSVGLALLLVSYTNFINFYAAIASVRVKYFNIRRIHGESLLALRSSMIMETVFLSFIAFLISILIIQFMNTGALKDFFRADLAILKNLELLIFTGIFSILAGFLAGLFPAFYTTSFIPAMALSGSFSLSLRSRWMKNILTGFQFITAIFLTVTMLFVKIQYDFLRNKDWGINSENVLYLNTSPIGNQVNIFTSELERNANIIDITTASHFPGEERFMGWGRNFENTRINMNVWSVDHNFFDLFNAKIIMGEGFNENDRNKMIVNNAFLRVHEFENFESIEGKEIDNNVIIGVVEDFNYKSLHGHVQPVAFISSSHNRWVFVKTNGMNTKQTIEYINETWKQFNSAPIEVLSLTETVQSLYEKERNTLSLVSICGIIAIIVAIIGLYGLILFDAKAKRRNIAIRKVHGASIQDVALMLNKSLFIRFGISCFVAFPLVYYAMNRWLEEFAYKTPIHWWVFVLGGLIVLAISLLTVSWETYRAANANPVNALKSE